MSYDVIKHGFIRLLTPNHQIPHLIVFRGFLRYFFVKQPKRIDNIFPKRHIKNIISFLAYKSKAAFTEKLACLLLSGKSNKEVNKPPVLLPATKSK